MTNYRAATDYGVGHESDAIISVRSFGLAVPRVVYYPFQAAYVRGDVTRAGDGPISVEWVWDVAHVEQVAALVRFLFTGESTQYVDCYVRTDKRIGYYQEPSQAFAIFSAIAWRPILSGPDGAYESAYQVNAARLAFKNLVEV